MRVNGKAYPYREGLTLHELLEELNIDRRTVAVMHREDVYSAGGIPDAPLGEPDVLEIVTMMQGG
jgi:thiamine biosynthesis protein ThiS